MDEFLSVIDDDDDVVRATPALPTPNDVPIQKDAPV